MANRIELELVDREVQERLAALYAAVTDTLPLMRGIAAELLAETEFAFMDEGPGWPQLSPVTVAARAARGAARIRFSRSPTPWRARSPPAPTVTRRRSAPI
ncbi:hypothetical protein P7I86_09155 [Pseudomonas aeruginosa]|nr:hypothetical protein [Pseudomonas aeruginosa]WGW41038.1 hypothetical protein P7I86_30640 [Pseudomonas aeruginosa]WGW41040.1 hypothetical protein P7I86_09155 [Pseudomonas aeruginosa]WGW53651.1 hypothetical protein P7I87_31585 [Pseudomonas aeruginosa]